MFSRSIAAAVAACALLAAGPVASQEAARPAAARAGPPSAEELLADPDFFGAQLSPNGRYVAMVQHNDKYRLVAVFDTETAKNTPAMIVPKADGYYFDWVAWKGDDRLLVGTTLLQIKRVGDREDAPITSLKYGRGVMSMDRDGKNSTLLFQDADGTSKRSRAFASLLDPLDKDPDHVLMQAMKGGSLSVWRANIRTGEATLVEAGNGSTVGWNVDHGGAVVARIEERNGWWKVHGRAPGETEWSEVIKVRTKEFFKETSDFAIVGPTEKPGELYVLVEPKTLDDGDTTALHVYDFKTKTLSAPVRRHARYDITGIVQDDYSGKLGGYCYVADVYQCEFEDKKVTANFRGLSKFFGGERDIVPTSFSRDGRHWLLQVSGADEPGAYYLYDWDTKHIRPIGNQYSGLTTGRLGVMKPFGWKARDGQELRGYLTRPPGEAKGPLPLIVMPHGGPERRDQMGYDAWVQYFATRGYLVFQPNFRGSGGFGRKFARAGYRQWGGLMQDDVVDGVEALIASGQVDQSRMCMVGASYGGYVALWAGATQPDLYRCVVSIAGVSELQDSMEWERRTYGADSSTYEYWVKSMGDPKADKVMLESRSPARMADRFKAPVLLIHGDSDWNVPIEQSRKMEKALKKAGRQVSLTVLRNEGHGDWSETNSKKVLTEMGAFVEKHLGPAAQPAASVSAAAAP